MNTYSSTIWDVVVVGGGPAGMMSAGTAAQSGARVLLIEKNDSLGKKLLITGGGRCNVTNAELDTRTLLKKFKENDKFLFSAFSAWSVQETLDFFHIRHMPTKEENEKRVFPLSEKASSVLAVLVEFLKQGQVTILSNSPVKKLIQKNLKEGLATIEAVELKDGTLIKGKTFILATGGTSRPETGSTGDGYTWLTSLGHTIAEPTASLVPIALAETWTRELAGVTLPLVKISVIQNGVRQLTSSTTPNSTSTRGTRQNKSALTHTGKILFTHVGVSGPTILNMSRDIGELIKYGDTFLSLDILPTLDHGTLNKKLNDLFRTESNKKFKNCVGLIDSTIPSSMIKAIVNMSGINPDTFAHSITREERLTLVDTFKNLKLKIKGLLGTDKAIVTSGGVDLREVDFKTMQSRLYPNLYLVGDILNIDRPSGGYSLQLCWTTGHVAGVNAVRR